MQSPTEPRPAPAADAPPAEAPPPPPPGAQSPAKSRRRRGLRWVKGVAGVALLLVLAVLVVHWRWARRVSADLDAQLAAIRAAGEPTSAEELNRWPDLVTGAGDNAVPHLRGAANLIYEGDPAWKAYTEGVERRLPLNDEEVAACEAVLKQFDPALRAAEEATSPPRARVDWAVQYKTPMFEQLGASGDLNGMRAVASLLQADGLLHFQRGDHARALRRVKQMLAIARAVDHQPTLVGHLVSIGLTAQAGALATEVVPDLRIGPASSGAEDGRAAPLEDVKALIADLLDDRPLRAGFRRAFVGERVLQLDAATGLADDRFDAGGVAGGSLRVPIPGAGYALRPVFRESATIMARFMTGVIQAVEKSPDWPAYLKNMPPRPPEADGNASVFPMRYKLMEILLPALDRAARQDYRCMTDRRLAATCLAARLYAADHDGHYPEKLEDLVPKYLPSVPLDPFSKTGAMLLYVSPATDPDKPRVYGVEENGDDNGGVEPDPMLPRREQDKIKDEIRHLKRQPRPKPVEFPPGFYPGACPGTYPGMPPGLPPGMFPGMDPGAAPAEAEEDADAPAAPEPGDEPPMEEADTPPPDASDIRGAGDPATRTKCRIAKDPPPSNAEPDVGGRPAPQV